MSAVRTLPNVVKDALDKSPGSFPLASVAIGRRRVALSNHWRAKLYCIIQMSVCTLATIRAQPKRGDLGEYRTLPTQPLSVTFSLCAFLWLLLVPRSFAANSFRS